MNLSLAALPLALAMVDWIAVAKNWKGLRYAAKPGVILALLALLGIFTGFRQEAVFFALALAFSLAGDVALILPKEQFKSALVFFLLAHLSYILAYNRGYPPPLLPSLVILSGLIFMSRLVFYRISEGVILSGNSRIKGPIRLYMLVHTVMVFSALITLLRPFWTPASAILTSAGALLFYYSDATLAWNRFVKPLPQGRLKVIISYHLAQIALVVGAILHYQSI